MDNEKLVEMWQIKTSEIISRISNGERMNVLATLIVDGRPKSNLEIDLALISILVHSMIAERYEKQGATPFEAMKQSQESINSKINGMLKDSDIYDVMVEFRKGFESEKVKRS